MTEAAVVVVKGSDHSLRARALDEVTARLLGDDDPTLALAEAPLPPARGRDAGDGGAEARHQALVAALDGARTPPFGTRRRVVVIRSDEALGAGEAELVARYVDEPEPTTALVLELPGRVPAVLAKSLKSVGAEEVVAGGGRSPTAGVLAERLDSAGLRLDEAARSLVVDRIGEDAARVPALVDLLVSTFGDGASLGADDVAPYLGASGSVPVFELTKAIDAGDVAGSLAVLQRLATSGGMHPLQVMAVLHNHYRRILRLDDPAVRSGDAAVDVVGGHPYPAKLAWERARRLGTEGIARAYDLLARADADVRGGSGAPDRAVLEVLVTRLAMLSRRSAGSRR